MQRGVLAVLLALSLAPAALAQEAIPRIVPVPAIGSDIAEIARTSGQTAEGGVTGGGRWLRVAYASEAPLTGFVVPLLGGAQYNPVDMLRFDLPASPNATVDVDLSASPSWSASSKDYMVVFAAGDIAPEIQGIGIVPASYGDSIGAFFRHAFASEGFVVSTYHMLRGYRILGVGLVPVLAVLVLLAAAGLAVWKKKEAAFPLLGLAFIAQLAYGARIDLDLARLTVGHAGGWFHEHDYAEAGSMYALADAVKDLEGDVRLAVCFDSTDYFAKLLRYLLLPIPAQIGTDGPMKPTHVAIVRKIDWTYEEGRLKCGSIDAPAELLEGFPDGSSLYAL